MELEVVLSSGQFGGDEKGAGTWSPEAIFMHWNE